MAAVAEGDRTVVAAHDAFGHFAQTSEMNFWVPDGASTESEASAADVAALIAQIREDGIDAVFVEAITDNRLQEQIANETGAGIGGTIYSDALSEEGGPAATYIDMMRHNAQTLSGALGSRSAEHPLKSKGGTADVPPFLFRWMRRHILCRKDGNSR